MADRMRKSGFLPLFFVVMLTWSLSMLLGPMVGVISAEFAVASETIIGNISGVFLLVTGLLAFAWVFIEDRLAKRTQSSRKTLLLLATAVWTAGLFLTSTATTYLQLFSYQMITAVGCAAIIPLAYAMVMDLTPPKGRARAFGLLEIASMVGASVVGYLIPGLLIDFVPWNVPFVMVAVFGLVVIGSLLRIADPERGAQERELALCISQGGQYNFRINRKGLANMLKSRANLLILMFTVIFYIASGSIVYYFIRMMVNDHGFSSALAVLVYIGIYSTQAIGSIFWTNRADAKFQQRQEGKVRVLLQCLVAGPGFMIAGYALTFTAGEIPLVVLFAGLLALGAFFLSGLMPIAFAVLGEVNPPEMRTTVFSMNNLSQTVGRGTGILLMGIFFTLWGGAYQWGFVIMSCLFLGGIFFLVPLLKSVPKELSRVSALLRARAHEIGGGVDAVTADMPGEIPEKIEDINLYPEVVDPCTIEEEIHEGLARNAQEIAEMETQLWHNAKLREELAELLDHR
jgi:MFS family permease